MFIGKLIFYNLFYFFQKIKIKNKNIKKIMSCVLKLLPPLKIYFFMLAVSLKKVYYGVKKNILVYNILDCI